MGFGVGAGDAVAAGDAVTVGDAVEIATGAGVSAAGETDSLATGKGGTEPLACVAGCDSVATGDGIADDEGAEVPPEEPLEQPAAARVSRTTAGQRIFMMVF